MFGLPMETTVLVCGVPLFWIAYTAIFLFRSRDWVRDEGNEVNEGNEGDAP